MGWEVANIETTVAALRARVVVFEEYDLPGLKTVNGIAEIEGTIQAKVSVRGASAPPQLNAVPCARDSHLDTAPLKN
jgi:hypothetical protein